MKEWRCPDGRTLTYREAGSGPPLVLVHGWAMSSAAFCEAIQELSDEFRVLAPDLPGHGGSTETVDYSLDALADDLLGWMEALDLGDIRLLGWSLGGQVALRLAVRAEPRLARLLLIATTPRFTADDEWLHGLPDGQVRIMARGLKRRFAATLDDFFSQQFVAGELGDERSRLLWQRVAPTVQAPRQEAALATLETLRLSDLRQEVNRLALSSLIMHGTEDVIIPHSAGCYLAEQLPQSKFHTMPGLGHAPFLSRPQECFRLWREFCRS